MACVGLIVAPELPPPPPSSDVVGRVEAEFVLREAADVAEDALENGCQHDQRDDDDRGADTEADDQPLPPTTRDFGIVGHRRANGRGLLRRVGFVDGVDQLGAVGDGGGLLQQVEKRRGAADAAARLDRPSGRRRDLERNVAVDRPGFDGLTSGVDLGRCQTASHPGLGQRPAVDQQRVQRRADAADVVLGGGVGHGRGERERDVTLDADPDPAGMVDRQRDTGPVGLLGRSGQSLHRAGAADRRRRRLGHLLKRPTADPLADDQAARTGVRDIEDARDAGAFDTAEPLTCGPGSPAVPRRTAPRRGRRTSGRPAGRARCPRPARTAGWAARRGKQAADSGRRRCWPRG